MASDFLAYLGSVIGHWGSLMTGGIIIAVLTLIERKVGRPIRWPFYALLAATFLFIATFQAWREQLQDNRSLVSARDMWKGQAEALKLENAQLTEKLAQSILGGRHRHAIREQLGKFINEGTALRERALGDSLSPQMQRDWTKWRVKVEHYLRDIDSSYEARFKTVNISGLLLYQKIMSEIAVLEKVLAELKD